MDINQIVFKMTLRQKAEFMTGKDFWQSKDFPELGVRSLFLADGPHGVRKQAAAADHLGLNKSIPSTCFPTSATMANSFNPEIGEKMGACLGREAAAMNVDVLLGPGVNIKRNPLCGRNFEYFSEDPYLAGKMGAAYICGIQSRGVAACVKHFAANNQEMRRMVIDSVVDERTLREIYLTPFEMAVKEGKTRTIMSAYNKINGAFANESNYLLKKVLRESWGFTGVVVTDWAGCNSRVEGIKAGNELEMPSCLYGIEDIINAIESGALSAQELDECVIRLLELIKWVGERGEINLQENSLHHCSEEDMRRTTVFQNRREEKDQQANITNHINYKNEHHKIAKMCAEESIVLLKNDGILPLSGKEKTVFIGDFADLPRYQGAGSSIVNPIKVVSALTAVKDYKINFKGFSQGFYRYGKKSGRLKDKAIRLALGADIIVYFMGLDEVSEAEGIDRSDMSLSQNQIDVLYALKNTGKKIVVALSCGSAVEMDWADDVSAIVHTYLGGEAGAEALMEVLCGNINPCGRLAESIPFKYEECPSAKYFPGKEMGVQYREALFVGYRYYTTANKPVRYPFGYGLSYTRFSYFDLCAEARGVWFSVKNTGEKAGATVAQMYISKPDSQIIRPVKELKGFKKVFLQRGETVRVTIDFDDYTFRYFNTVTDSFETEGGDYTVIIGDNAESVTLSVQVKKQSTAQLPYSKEEFPVYFSGNINSVSDDEFSRLLGHEPPPMLYKFYKKRRMKVHENSTVADLKYSTGFAGRVFSWGIRTAIKVLSKIGKRKLANTLVMGVLHQPIRGIAKFGGMNRRKLEGMIKLFNGSFFKGFGMLIFKGKKYNKEELVRKKV